MTVTPNLHFTGQCMEAIALYRRAFGAEVLSLLTNADANPQDWACEAGAEAFVYHAEIRIGEQRLMMNDCASDALNPGQSMSIVITCDTAREVRNVCAVLSEGGTILSPIQATTYSSAFVSLIDRCGMRWELMTEQTER